jgi:hypothetical protein
MVMLPDRENCSTGARWRGRRMTATIGPAYLPAEAVAGEDLGQLADRRL